MKTILVYYSMGGNTDYAAKKIAERTGAELLRLETARAYPKSTALKMFWCGRAAMFGDRPKLKPYTFSAKDYDLVILGSPVWAGTITPPLRTFLRDNSLAGCRTAFFSCQAGDVSERFVSEMRAALKGCTIVAEGGFTAPLSRRCAETDARIDEFCPTLGGETL